MKYYKKLEEQLVFFIENYIRILSATDQQHMRICN